MSRRLPKRQQSRAKTDLWVVPYADMMTLLFALFVVLHSMGRVELDRLARLRESIQFAMVGDGGQKGQRDQHELFDNGPVGGEIIDGIALVNRQKGPMIEFLLETLPEEFEKRAGRSVKILLNERAIVVEAETLAYFEPGSAVLRDEVAELLVVLLQGLETESLEMRTHVTFPRDPKDGPRRQLSGQRANRLHELVKSVPQVNPAGMEFGVHVDLPAAGPWESRSRVRIELEGSL
ncbi:MAG: flagellar motor protein MotB [Planctomycetota bacterium]